MSAVTILQIYKWKMKCLLLSESFGGNSDVRSRNTSVTATQWDNMHYQLNFMISFLNSQIGILLVVCKYFHVFIFCFFEVLSKA